MKNKIKNLLNHEVVFGIMVISGLLILYYFVFARLVLSREYTFGGDTYCYWSLNYFVLYSIKHFNSLPWWDPTNLGGFPLYYHFISGWSNYLGPFFLPSLVLFKALNLFVDVSINDYIVFHRTLYIVSLNMIAVFLISRELIKNRIASILPVFIFTFSYFQLMNFHDFYTLESMIAPLFFIFALIRFNNKRNRGSLILLLFFSGLLLASLDNGIVMSAVYWTSIFAVLLLIFNISLIKDAYLLLIGLVKTTKGKITAGLLLLLIVFGFISAWLPFHFNTGHVLVYRGGSDGMQPVTYNTSGKLTDNPLPIAKSEILTVVLNWLPFPEVHDMLLRLLYHGHENRYIGLVTIPLIFAAITLCLRNSYIYILFLTYFICNAFIIYTTDNLVYKILTDSSEIFRNVRNMSTIFPRGGPPLFLVFLAGIGFDKLIEISSEKKVRENETDSAFKHLFKRAMMILMILSCVFIFAGIMSFPLFLSIRHSLSHMGIYLLIFSFICRILFMSNSKLMRGALIFCLLILTFTGLIVAASANIANRFNAPPDEVGAQIIIPYNELDSMNMVISDNTVFKPINSESEKMFAEGYFGVHNNRRISWGIKEWLMLVTRDDGLRFLTNWAPRFMPPNSKHGRMSKYPDFKIFTNGYYLPFEKIKELDMDKSIYHAVPLFYLHDEQMVNSKRTHPLEPVYGSYTIKEYTPNKAVIQTMTDRDGFLYFLDNYDRFWSAYVDGKKVKIHRANFTFKAIELPAGIHNVAWTYNPYPVKIAYLIFYLLLMVFVILYCSFRNRTVNAKNAQCLEK
jgi:hypothetical protein